MNTGPAGFGSYLWRATKATLLGGLAFLLPLVVVLIILGKAMTFSAHVMEPVIKHLPPSPFTASLVGAASLVALIVISLLAGLVAHTRIASRVIEKLEDTVLGGIPQYQFAKSAASSFAQLEQSEGLEPVLVSIEDGWQLGYQIEALHDGWVAVMLPQSPTPMSGNVMYFSADRIRKLDITMMQAMSIVKRLGAGSAEALKTTQLGPA
jgi:uncharacterized membrane protein